MSQKSLQTSGYTAFNKLLHGILAKIDCAYLAKVTEYDDKKHIADILPLMNTSYGEASSQFLDVPVLANCYRFDDWLKKAKKEFKKVDDKASSNLADLVPDKPLMKKGAIVLVVVLDGNADNWDGSAATFKPDSPRRHDANDSIIVGVI